LALNIPVIAVIGVSSIVAIYVGKIARKAGLPSLIGYMILGTFVGTSVLSLISENSLNHLQFITDIALGFVAFTIGSELNLKILKRLGKGIILIILAESFAAFFVVGAAVYLLTGDLPMALIFGALAPASAPAGTVAVIQEYKTKGNLTKALYAVVGFDDGLAVIIFGFSAALAARILQAESSSVSVGFLSSVTKPLLELALSLGAGTVLGFIFSALARKLRPLNEIPALIFGFITLSIGLCMWFNLSLILTNMMLGFVLANTTSITSARSIVGQLKDYMPLLFILFFLLAGAHLQISALPALGILGIVYMAARTAGLMGGAWLGAVMGKSESKIRKYLGFGILSQAGVAIGLSLIVRQMFEEIGSPHALAIGATVITTVTATSIIFEIVGPICAKFALGRAGEIPKKSDSGSRE
jgi:Kef-type K+ transport system membrane component KefB